MSRDISWIVVLCMALSCTPAGEPAGRFVDITHATAVLGVYGSADVRECIRASLTAPNAPGADLDQELRAVAETLVVVEVQAGSTKGRLTFTYRQGDVLQRGRAEFARDGPDWKLTVLVLGIIS